MSAVPQVPPLDPLTQDKIKLVEFYLRADKDGKDIILRVAEMAEMAARINRSSTKP